MKIIRNKYIPFQGYKAINLFGILFVRGNSRISDVDMNHEEIHSYQIKEMLYLLFYIWYIAEWLIKSLRYWSFAKGYKNCSFEREAYTNQTNLKYLQTRKPWAFIKHI